MSDDMRSTAAKLSGKLKYEVRTVTEEIDALEAALLAAVAAERERCARAAVAALPDIVAAHVRGRHLDRCGFDLRDAIRAGDGKERG